MKLHGTLKNVEAIDPTGQGKYPVLTIDTRDGAVAVHAFHSVLRRELARRAPKIGDELDIVYLGKRPGGRGAEYHNYRVSGGQVQEYDWSQELPEGERAMAEVDVPIAPAPVATVADHAEKVLETHGVPPAPANEDDGDVPF